MTIIHTIKLQNEVQSPAAVTSSTRRTTWRRYVAVIVATATERSVQLAAEKLAEKLASGEEITVHWNRWNRQPTSGEQTVVSWHMTEASACVALDARVARYFRERGDEVAIRTDIEVASKGNR